MVGIMVTHDSFLTTHRQSGHQHRLWTGLSTYLHIYSRSRVAGYKSRARSCGSRALSLLPSYRAQLSAVKMTNYQKMVDEAAGLLRTKSTWAGLQPEHVARMRLQNQFKTGLDVAKYTAKIMRKDMEDYDRDNT